MRTKPVLAKDVVEDVAVRLLSEMLSYQHTHSEAVGRIALYLESWAKEVARRGGVKKRRRMALGERP